MAKIAQSSGGLTGFCVKIPKSRPGSLLTNGIGGGILYAYRTDREMIRKGAGRKPGGG